ncbi:hypothetical protein VTO73DRAFT_10432 [Trametes versicolor]
MPSNHTMMRLLNTTSGHFKLVSVPKDVRYAILSHTWEAGGEQGYAALAKLQSALSNLSDEGLLLSPHTSLRTPATDSILSHPAISSKIKHACRVAHSHGFELLWMDACCIDKSSSAELIESLNSMYEWYRQASVCYVYLADVPSTDNIGSPGSAFRASRWHRRGWTLQELIAPTNVVFLSLDWHPLGTKTTLAALLESITGVDANILLHKIPLSSVSVARRMWWASSRQTTRVEDEAYALMGIFDVRIPMVYGEGRKAFSLLQEEILKTIPDQSLFAWGPKFSSSPESASAASLLPRSLLAVSPRDFRMAKMITPLSSKHFQDAVWGSSRQQGQPEHTSIDVCLDCKRYYRIWALPYADVRAINTDISIGPLIVRRIPLDNGPSNTTPPLRIRRIFIQSWCKAMLDAQGYESALHRATTSAHANAHVLTLRLKGCAGAAPSLIPHTEEIELHIAQAERTDGVRFTVYYGRQRARHGSSPSWGVHPLSLAPSVSRQPDNTRLSHFVPFTGMGEARHEFDLRGTGSAVVFAQKLYVTLQNYTEPVWTFGGWGQAPYVDFSLNVELSADTVGAFGHERRGTL